VVRTRVSGSRSRAASDRGTPAPRSSACSSPPSARPAPAAAPCARPPARRPRR